MPRWLLLLPLFACDGAPTESEPSCDDSAVAVRTDVQRWAADLPAGMPLPDNPRMALLPPAAADDAEPGLGHSLFYDVENPTGKPVWVLKGKPLAAPGELPDIDAMASAFSALDDKEMGHLAPLVLHIPASAPMEGVMALLRPLGERGWVEWHVLTTTPAGRTLTPKPVAPEGVSEALDALARPGPMGPGGGRRSQAALLQLYRSLEGAQCDVSQVEAMLSSDTPSTVAQIWTSLLDAWTGCGCAVPADEVRWLAHQALSEHELRHLVSLHLRVDGEAAIEASTWGEWLTAVRALTPGEDGLPHTGMP